MKSLPWLAALVVLLIPAPAAAIPPAQVELRADLQRTVFGTDQVATYRLHNVSPVTATGWLVEFDLPADTTIVNSWNARFARTGNHVTVQPESWNATLAPGASVYFGWYARGAGEPALCLANSRPCDGVQRDETDPTRPAPLTIDIANGVTLRWAASTDNRQLQYYEVYESGRLLTTTTTTSYVFTTGNSLPPRVYIFWVRAVDAAGNYSASAYAFLGAIPSPVPPAPGRLAIAAAGPGTQRLTWEQPVPPPVWPAPIVAGYEVSLDGQPVAVTGATRYVGPIPSTGEHTWSVRAIDAQDRRSEPGELTQVVG